MCALADSTFPATPSRSFTQCISFACARSFTATITSTEPRSQRPLDSMVATPDCTLISNGTNPLLSFSKFTAKRGTSRSGARTRLVRWAVPFLISVTPCTSLKCRPCAGAAMSAIFTVPGLVSERNSVSPRSVMSPPGVMMRTSTLRRLMSLSQSDCCPESGLTLVGIRVSTSMLASSKATRWRPSAKPFVMSVQGLKSAEAVRHFIRRSGASGEPVRTRFFTSTSQSPEPAISQSTV